MEGRAVQTITASDESIKSIRNVIKGHLLALGVTAESASATTISEASTAATTRTAGSGSLPRSAEVEMDGTTGKLGSVEVVQGFFRFVDKAKFRLAEALVLLG